MHRVHGIAKTKAVKTDKDMEKHTKAKGCDCHYFKGGAVTKGKASKSSKRCS